MNGNWFAGRYELQGRLGSGAYGEVWRAYDHNQSQEVALKLFRPGVTVFLAFYEARILTALEGPYILKVLNADVYQDVPFIVTRVAPLGSAEDRLSPFGVSIDVAVRWVRDVLAGLDVCHSNGLLHRDVKPSNIFLESMDRAQVGDFGVAWLIEEDGTTPAHGDPRVRAPEMWTLGRGSIASDIYSAGVTLYALLSGRYPFEQESEEDLESAIVAGDFPPLRDVAPHVPRKVAMRVAKAMSLDPAERFDSVRGMHEALGVIGPLPRIWQRISPHQDHLSCWLEKPRRTGAALQVCVLEGNRGYEVITRRASGSQSRVTAYCDQVFSDAKLQVFLRHIFDHV